jgi:hypothetical protein
LRLAHALVGIGPVPGQHLHGVAARRRLIFSTDQSSISEERRPPSVSWKIESFERDDEALGGREQRHAAGQREMRIEQHRGGVRLQFLHEHQLEARHVLEGRFRGAALLLIGFLIGGR